MITDKFLSILRYAGITALLSAAIFFAACCDDSSSPSHASLTDIVPGVDFVATDMFISSSSVHLVLKNVSAMKYPSFYSDYVLECGESYKDYDELFVWLDAYEQKDYSFYVGSGIGDHCRITLTSVRDGKTTSTPHYVNPWEGTFVVDTGDF